MGFNLRLLIFLVFCCLIANTEARVIKKRELDLKSTTEAGSVNNFTEIQPTILSPIPNKNEVVTTKLQLVAGKSFVTTESSKELTNNEILINEAKKLLEEEDKLIKTKKEEEIQQEEREAHEEKVEKEEQEENKQEDFVKKPSLKETVASESQENLQDIKQIILNLENKEQKLSENSKTSEELKGNDIKEDKIEEEKQEKSNKENLQQQEENPSSLENSLKVNEEKPRPPSRILPELRTEAQETPHKTPTIKETQIENSIENVKNNAKEKANKESTVEIITLKMETTTTTPAKTEEIPEQLLKTQENEKEILVIKTLGSDSKEKEFQETVKNTNPLDITTFIVENDKETSTSKAQASENLQVIHTTTINPSNDINKANNNNIKEISDTTENTLRETKTNNNIQNNLDLEELLSSGTKTTTPESTLDSTLYDKTKEQDLLIFEGEKKEYARSMKEEELTTLMPLTNNEVLMPITTYRPIILSVKEENLKEQIEVTPFINKEKKPKFINDNSTNAQQLNLPNNSEAWSLAAMKSLPKANSSLETAHEQTETISKDFKENLVNNSSIMMTMNTNSEKNLLDWSQIMRDKELATTTSNKEKMEENDQEEKGILTTLKPEFREEAEREDINRNKSISPTTEATILSLSSSNNNNENDKKFEENMNNHLEMITENLDMTTTTTSTTQATILANNPLNKTLSMEPKLNEINLTLNHTQQQHEQQQPQAKLNNEEEMEVEVHTTSKATGMLNNAGDVITTTTTTLTSALTTTEATAVVVDMTKVEQISSETTTVSTLETSKQNASLNNTNSTQNDNDNNNNNNINVNFVKRNYTLEPNELENNALENFNSKTNNQYETTEKDLETTTTTTTVLPITTFRPSILAITSSTTTSSLPVLFEQEVKVDQNGNHEFQTNLTNSNEKQQQINVNNNNNSMNISETHLLEREFETTTTTTTTIESVIATTIPTETQKLNETKIATENTLTSLEEINTTTTSTTTTTTESTSSSQEVGIVNETTERILETKEETTTTQTTPKFEEEQQTTIGSAVDLNIEKKVDDIQTTTTATPTETIIISTTTISSQETSKTPVVVIESTTLHTPTTTSTTTTTIANSETEEATLTTTTPKQETENKEDFAKENDAKLETTTMSTTTATSTLMPATVVKDEETYISLLDDTTTTTQAYSPAISITSTAPTPTTTTAAAAATATEFSTSPPPSSLSSTTSMPSAITTKVEEIYNVIHSTTTELIQTTTQQIVTEIVEDSSSPSSTSSPLYPSTTDETLTTPSIIATADIGKSLPTLTSIMGGNSGNMYPKNSEASGETDVNVIIAITVSVIGVIALVLLVGFLYLMRKRQKQNSYPNRCRPVSMDEFTIDNASVGGSMRKSSALRSSKRTYGNLAFDDPSLRHNPMGVHELAKFVQEKLRIFEEFRDVPQITSRLDEVPPGCEDKNRYANVLPLPETRVILQRLNDDDKTEYINANYVTGPKDPPNYYIACQAPLDSTVEDFWRMIWEQQSRVIIQATDLIENGVEKCAEYLPPSVTLDNHSSFGDFQITLQNREVKDKYAISTILLKNVNENASRELTHYWYKWPEVGVPAEEAPIIAMLLEARSSLISYAIEQANEDKEKSSMATLKSAEEGTAGTMNGGASPKTNNNSNGSSANGSSGEINGNISMVHIKKTARNQGPLTIHCSPGTGRTGTIIACDIAIRSLETPKRTVDIPQIVYYVRRGRASAVLTKEQYEFIYKVANMYAAKISNPTNYN